MRNAELMRRLEAFEIGREECALPFAARLARENGWRRDYAKRVITEYKRFVYLVAAGDGELTPSDEVDQAWHLHLLYTRSYWKELCGGLLGRELHHLPTRGGSAEGARFAAQYRATLEFYAREFGHPPPADIWPDVAARFRQADRFQRVNVAHRLLLPRPPRWLGRLAAVSLALPLLVSCALGSADEDPWFWVKTGLGIAAAIYLVKKLNDWLGGSGGGGGGGFGCGGDSGCGSWGDGGDSGCGGSGCGGCGGD